MHVSYDDDDHPDWEKTIHPCFTATEDADGEGSHSSSLIPVQKQSKPGHLHDLNLLRMAQVANECTVREFGPLLQKELSATQKRRPIGPCRDFLTRSARETEH